MNSTFGLLGSRFGPEVALNWPFPYPLTTPPLQGFMAEHPELVGRDFFITGESYAGHYVPAITHRIAVVGQFGAHDRFPIHLKGMAVGNGLVDPAEQYPQYAEFALQNGMIGACRTATQTFANRNARVRHGATENGP
jgi:carboxypeptidase C (cathepsin A)